VTARAEHDAQPRDPGGRGWPQAEQKRADMLGTCLARIYAFRSTGLDTPEPPSHTTARRSVTRGGVDGPRTLGRVHSTEACRCAMEGAIPRCLTKGGRCFHPPQSPQDPSVATRHAGGIISTRQRRNYRRCTLASRVPSKGSERRPGLSFAPDRRFGSAASFSGAAFAWPGRCSPLGPMPLPSISEIPFMPPRAGSSPHKGTSCTLSPRAPPPTAARACPRTAE